MIIVGDGVLDVPPKKYSVKSDLRDVEDAVPYKTIYNKG